MNRFKEFANAELYMLKCQAIEASFYIKRSGKFTNAKIEIHNNLLKEIVEEFETRKVDNQSIIL